MKDIHGSFEGSSFWSCSSLGQGASCSPLWAFSQPASAPCQPSLPGGRTPAWPQCFLASFVAWCGSPLPHGCPFRSGPLFSCSPQPGWESWADLLRHMDTHASSQRRLALQFVWDEIGRSWGFFLPPSPSPPPPFILVFMKLSILFLVWESKINHPPTNLNKKENDPNSGDRPREQWLLTNSQILFL